MALAAALIQIFLNFQSMRGLANPPVFRIYQILAGLLEPRKIGRNGPAIVNLCGTADPPSVPRQIPQHIGKHCFKNP